MKDKPNVEFVSYDGGYPNLCLGTLILKIHGFIVTCPKYILSSGGSAYFENNYKDSVVTSGEWSVDRDAFNQFDDNIYQEIVEVVNDNIPWGCCGGCL